MSYVEMRGITKRYGPVTANDHINFSFERAEIHALLGENGAGKTTLMRILYGMTRAESGSIVVNGAPVLIRSPRDAINLNISMVHQHFMLADPLSVVENIVLGYEPHRFVFHDIKRAIREAATLCDKFSLKVNLKAPVGSIAVGEKQRVEIIKALYRRSEIIILDEPTAVLTSLEVQEFFSVLRKLKESGKTIIIITHKLKEVMSISDTVTVLCRGRWMSTVPTVKTNSAELAELMVGHKVSTADRRYGRVIPKNAPVYLELENVSALTGKITKLRNLSLKIRSAEILGICGVEGNGQAELAETVTGIRSPAKGAVKIKGKVVEKADPRRMLDLGLAHIPGDRAQDGLIRSLSIAGNIILGYQRRPRFLKRGLISWDAVKHYAETMAVDFDIRAADVSNPVSSLSGGNQQKVVIARSLSQNPDIIIAVQPTRGVDIGAVEYIHGKLLAMRDAGKAILLISTEVDELLRLSDTIAVLYDGTIAAQGPAEGFDERRLALLMTGLGTGVPGFSMPTAHGEG
jgi:simple sugar transport system ATP-binding protein